MRTLRIALLLLLPLLLLLTAAGAAAAARAQEIDVPLRSWTLTPGDLPIELPAHFDDKLARAPQTYVLRTRVTLPEALDGVPLTFAVQQLQGVADLEVGGVPATPLDATPFDTYRTTGAARWRVPPQHAGRPLDLALSVRHRWRPSAWIDAVPVLTNDPFGGRRLVAVDLFDHATAVVGFGTNALVVLLYGFLFFSVRNRKRSVHGLFALGAAAMMSYPAFVLGLMQPVFGVFEAQIVTAMVLVGAVAAIYFTHAYFELPRPHGAWLVWLGLALGITIASYDPFRARWLGPLVAITSAANALVQLRLLFVLRRREPQPRNLYLIVLAWPATAILGLADFWTWLGHGDLFAGVRTVCLGMGVIAVSQAMALLREHVHANARADALNAELARRVEAAHAKQREVELLNDELRRQIAARTRQLAVSLVDTEAVLQNVQLAPGDVIEERYVVVRLLGEGGMGAVYEVERVQDKKHFALKTLTGVAMGDPFARARFAREAEIAANVKHPNVVALIDFDIAKQGYLFLVMEFVEGSTLHEVRRRNHDVPWTLYVLAQVAAGLDAVHTQGIVHRDLKPANVLLSRGSDGRRPLVKITDFGVSSLLADEGRSSFRMLAANPVYAGDAQDLPAYDAGRTLSPDELPTEQLTVRDGIGPSGTAPLEVPQRATSETPPPGSGPAMKPPKAALTKTGAIFGTPNYMAAELTRGTKTATRAADVFSLGVIAFELLTFRRPFAECPVHMRLRDGALVVAPRFAEVCPELPPDVAQLLDRALSHAPTERPTAHELAVALRAAYDKLARASTNPPTAPTRPERVVNNRA